MPRFDAEWIDFILRPERRGSPPAEDVLETIGIAERMVVADVGCGPGFLTFAAASLVGQSGRVYAVDVEPTMLDYVAREARERGLTNVEICRSAGLQLPLADSMADLTICALVLHDLDDPTPLARELGRITRTTGRIAIVEWTPLMDDPRRNRVTADVTRGLLQTIGWEPGPVVTLSDQQYLVIGS
jgi:ubiquinone/menaquinone biosynthesis C-methylase UbiE